MVYNFEFKIQLEAFTIDPFERDDPDPFASVYFSDWENVSGENFSADVRELNAANKNNPYVQNMTFRTPTSASLYRIIPREYVAFMPLNTLMTEANREIDRFSEPSSILPVPFL